MNYTGKQKARLRSLANAKPIMFQIGQNGVTEQVITNVLDYLKKHEIGRISMLRSCPQSMDEVVSIFTENGVYVVYTIGHVLLMYKENKDKKDRIRL